MPAGLFMPAGPHGATHTHRGLRRAHRTRGHRAIYKPGTVNGAEAIGIQLSLRDQAERLPFLVLNRP